MFVGRVVVGNGVDQLACGHGALDGNEEADELLMTSWAMQRPSTVPSRTLRTANRVVTPFRL